MLNVVYQPFLSSTRTKQLTSLLQSAIPFCNFLPVHDTFLHFPQEAQIILLSRGGTPFAPILQRPSIDCPSYPGLREDLINSSKRYTELLAQWKDVQRNLPPLVEELRQYFSEQTIQKETFSKPLQVLAYTGEIKDVDSMLQKIKLFRKLRRARDFLLPILEKTQPAAKLAAEKEFGIEKLRSREYVIERYRDHLDQARRNLEERYMGMGIVTYPESVDRPWVLLPPDPVAAWGQDFAYRVEKLIRAAKIRFLSTYDEQEMAIEQEAKEIISESPQKIALQAQRLLGGNVTAQDVVNKVKDELRAKKARLYKNDLNRISLASHSSTDFWAQLDDLFKTPMTREEKAVYHITEQELVANGAWRVED